MTISETEALISFVYGISNFLVYPLTIFALLSFFYVTMKNL